MSNASLPVGTCVNAASDASSSRITSSMHAMWMCTLPEGFDWDLPDFSPLSMMLIKFSPCVAWNMNVMGFFANGLIFLSSSTDCGAGLAFCILPELCSRLHGAHRILMDADLEESIRFFGEAQSSVQSTGVVQKIGDRLVVYDRCCISHRTPSRDH